MQPDAVLVCRAATDPHTEQLREFRCQLRRLGDRLYRVTVRFERLCHPALLNRRLVAVEFVGDLRVGVARLVQPLEGVCVETDAPARATA